jgi:Ni,Fe-hydrogenase III small subunit
MSAPDATGRAPATVAVLPLETGGCGACAQSLYALHAPRYAAELAAQGITFARSPRHADILLLCGPMTTTARAAVRRVVEALPEPRALVAVGDCAITGCVFSGSPYLSIPPADDLDANVEIAGCPPSPSSILAAIAEAAQLLADSSAADAGDTHDAAASDDDAEEEPAQ